MELSDGPPLSDHYFQLSEFITLPLLEELSDMDDIIHLVATGGAGVSTVCTLICIWLLHRVLDEIDKLQSEIDEVKTQQARLDERTKWKHSRN